MIVNVFPVFRNERKAYVHGGIILQLEYLCLGGKRIMLFLVERVFFFLLLLAYRNILLFLGMEGKASVIDTHDLELGRGDIMIFLD